MAEEVVLLGLLDEEVGDFDTTWAFNKLGGQPDWLCGHKETPVCGECGRLTSMVCQIYCPLDGTTYHRTLYLFACCSSSCWNKPASWCVLRGQKLDETSQKQQQPRPSPAQKSGDLFEVEDDWGDDSAVWDEQVDVTTESMETPCRIQNGTSIDANVSSEDLEDNFQNVKETLDACTQLHQMSLDDKIGENTKENRHRQDVHMSDIEAVSECSMEEFSAEPESQILRELLHRQTPEIEDESEKSCQESKRMEFKSFFLSVVEEPSEITGSKHERRLLAEYERKEGRIPEELSSAKDSGSGECYEKSAVRHGDRTFLKFHKRIALCPEQILRYSWNGAPLYVTQPTGLNVTPPKCRCGASRVFELQLLPSMINYLVSSSGATVEFGTVLIYTCSASCWDSNSSYQKETVVIQADSDLDFLNRKT